MSEQTSEKEPRYWLGNAKEKERQSGDKFLVGSICLDDLESVPKELISVAKNGKRYLRIVINPYMNGANEYGNTHGIRVDTFKPQRQEPTPMEEGWADGQSPEDLGY